MYNRNFFASSNASALIGLFSSRPFFFLVYCIIVIDFKIFIAVGTIIFPLRNKGEYTKQSFESLC